MMETELISNFEVAISVGLQFGRMKMKCLISYNWVHTFQQVLHNCKIHLPIRISYMS